ncbi:sialic acid synthase-like protein [Dinothrombium tinctorium]|uniref:Sialic acid synthase-like protein n=1 Tax=Dinothrombium tinctorium TaxID=1965070 RepID=A0A3S3NXG1_9ACAR|nr:sialic acid synthase-like protein [Dinothrombium tinctorium]
MAATSSFELTPNRYVGCNQPCFVIAEIGQNHCGSIDLAMRMIKLAAELNCDCVKFQKSYLNAKFTRSALQKPYSSPHSFGATYGEHKAALEFSEEQFVTLQKYAFNEGIAFTASAMDKKALEFLCKINVPFIKIGSGDCNNWPLLKQTAEKCNKPIVLSTGMQDFTVVKQAYELIAPLNHRLCVLHCVSSYPTPDNDVHLNVIKHYSNAFPSSVIGYSGHENGIEISLAAVAIGAKVLERHFTLDKRMKGTDQKCSLEPNEFKQLITSIRRIETAMGTQTKARRESEMECYRKLGKSIVTAKTIEKGTTLNDEHLDVKVSQPPGIEAQHLYTLIGRKTKNNLDKECPIQYSDLE